MTDNIEDINYTYVSGTIDNQGNQQKETLIFLINIVNSLHGTDKHEELRIATIDPINFASPYIYDLTTLITIEIFINDFSHKKIYLTKDISKETFIKTELATLFCTKIIRSLFSFDSYIMSR